MAAEQLPQRHMAAPRMEIPAATCAYVAGQTALTLVLAAWVLWFRSRHSPVFLVVGAVAILWSLASIGALLDGRAGAKRFEAIRVAALALAALFVAR